MVLGLVQAALVTALVAGAGAALGGPVAGALGGALALGPAVALALATASSRAYDRSSRRGWLQYLVDCTWSLPNTLAGALFLTVNLAVRNRVDLDRSRGSGCVHLEKGIIPGFATTIGTVVAGAGPRIERHERLHVTQARAFGPLYLPLVAANYVVATVLPYWLLYHDRQNRPIRSVRDYFMRGVYPHTWHEQWAYAVEGTPP